MNNNNNIDDVEEVITRWDKDYDFRTLHHHYDDDFSLEMVDKKHKEVMKIERTIFRRQVNTNSLNEHQLCTHDLIIRALMLDKNESVTDRGNNVS